MIRCECIKYKGHLPDWKIMMQKSFYLFFFSTHTPEEAGVFLESCFSEDGQWVDGGCMSSILFFHSAFSQICVDVCFKGCGMCAR